MARNNKITQKQVIIDELLKEGYVSRNWALQKYISRLGAIVQELEYENWEFDTQNLNKNYYYKLKKCPYKTVTYKLPNGQTITNIIK